MPPTVDIDPLDLVDPARFARNGYPYDTWARLRAEAPVSYVEPPGYPPFWAVTKHADIVAVATKPEIFSSSGGITLDMDLSGLDMVPEMIVYLDPPRHGPLRQVVNKKFLKSAVRSRSEQIEQIATEIVDEAATAGEIRECDFADTFAAQFPVAVISWMLGVPKADWEHHFRWTNEVIGKDDPEYRQPGETPDQSSMRARGEIHRYFKGMVKDRREHPRDDLVTQLVQSEIEGVPLNQAQLISYCELLVEAGNQTTRDAIAGGMAAFCEPSGPVGEACGPTLSYSPMRSRKSCAGSPRSPTSPARPPRTTSWAASRSGPGTKWRSTGLRPTATKTSSRTRLSSASTDPCPTSTWSSALALTSAWGPTWPGSSWPPCSGS